MSVVSTYNIVKRVLLNFSTISFCKYIQKNHHNFLNIITFLQNEAEALKVCDIYDWDGKGELDMYYFMDIFYAIGMNITKKACVKHGQTDDTGKKFAKFGEVIEKMKLAAAEPDNSGNYHDYVELCKLYDKNENGTMMLAELENILCNLGKKWLDSVRSLCVHVLKFYVPTYQVRNHVFNIIIADEVPKEDAAKMFAELAPPEDDDGFIPYVPFLDKLCGKA